MNIFDTEIFLSKEQTNSSWHMLMFDCDASSLQVCPDKEYFTSSEQSRANRSLSLSNTARADV